MTKEKILIVDRETSIYKWLMEDLKNKSFEIERVESGEKALTFLSSHDVEIVICCLDPTDLDLLKKIKELHSSVRVVMIASHTNVETVVKAMQLGAAHYLVKPFSLDAIESLLEEDPVAATSARIPHRSSKETQFDKVIYESPVMLKIMDDVAKVAKSRATVFISGESGTGKEVIANLIHHSSIRAGNPFIRVNCAAMPETLIESEFFGHEKGSFTGALSKRAGRFELADGGSLLLDEITEIPLNLQSKLLRVIQEQEFERVGGSKPVKVDVRLISTTNRDIKKAMESKLFREDLYYRLNVIPIHLPPLRERKPDIIPLTVYFLERFCKENQQPKRELTRQVQEILLRYTWPGNVRELANVMERVIVMDHSLEDEVKQLIG